MTSAQSSSQNQFYFLNGWPANAETYSGRVRAHVLRKHIARRKVRCKRRQKQQPEVDCDGKEQVAASRQQVSRNNQCGFDLLLQALADPFSSFARSIANYELFLLQKYVNHKYPWLQTPSFDDDQFNPSRDIFYHFNCADSLTVDVMAWYGSSSLCRTNNDTRLWEESLVRKSKAIQNLNRRLEIEGDAPSPHLLVSVCGIVCTIVETEDHQKNYYVEFPSARAHIDGLRYLIKAFGGWESIKAAGVLPLTWLLLWADAEVSGIILHEITQASKPEPPSYPGTNLSPDSAELLYVYRSLYDAASSRWSFSNSTGPNRPVLRFIWLFQPVSVIHRILRNEATSRISRLVPLVFINLVVHKTEHLPDAEQRRLYDTYQESFMGLRIEKNPSSEVLTMALMTDTRNMSCRELPLWECTMRLNFAASKMKPEVQRKLADTLCDFILLFHDEALLGRSNWWTPEQFADVVMEQMVH